MYQVKNISETRGYPLLEKYEYKDDTMHLTYNDLKEPTYFGTGDGYNKLMIRNALIMRDLLSKSGCRYVQYHFIGLGSSYKIDAFNEKLLSLQTKEEREDAIHHYAIS